MAFRNWFKKRDRRAGVPVQQGRTNGAILTPWIDPLESRQFLSVDVIAGTTDFGTRRLVGTNPGIISGSVATRVLYFGDSNLNGSLQGLNYWGTYTVNTNPAYSPFYVGSESLGVNFAATSVNLGLTVASPATKTHAPTLVATLTRSDGVPFSGNGPHLPANGDIQSASSELRLTVPTFVPPPLPEELTPAAIEYYSSGSVTVSAGTGWFTRLGMLAGSSLTPTPAAPTGLVSFYVDGNLLGAAPVSPAGHAVFIPSSPLPAGLHTLTAVYDGDAYYIQANASPLDVEVTSASTETSLTIASTETSAGQRFTLSARVSTTAVDSVRPTGSVTFREGDTLLGVVQLGADAPRITLKLAPGAHDITAVYSGDENMLASESASTTLTVRAPLATAIKLQKWGGNTKNNRPVFTASIVNPDGTPFSNARLPDLSAPGTIQSASAGITLKDKRPMESDPLVGAVNLIPFSRQHVNSELIRLGTLLPSVNPRPTTVVAGSLLFRATNVPPPPPIPGGVVAFYDGKTLVGRATVDENGTATFSPKKLPEGQHNIRALYAGSSHFAPAISETLAVEMRPTRTKTVLPPPSGPLTPGGLLSLTATTTTLDPEVAPLNGRIAFYLDGRLIAKSRLGGGKSPLVKLNLSPGVHRLRAVYEGDLRAAASESATISFTVLPSTPVSPKPVRLR